MHHAVGGWSFADQRGKLKAMRQIRSTDNRLLSGKRVGLTLIEIVVALAIAGGLLVAAILSATQHQRQIVLANEKQQAIETLDRFLTQWSKYDFEDAHRSEAAQASQVRLAEDIAGQPGRLLGLRFSLKTERVQPSLEERQLGASIPLEVIRVEMLANRPRGTERTGIVLSWIEIIRPRSDRSP